MNIISIDNLPPSTGTGPNAHINSGITFQQSTRVDSAAPKAAGAEQTTATNASPSEEEVKTSVNALNELTRSMNSNLSFSIDKDTGQTVVKVVDSSTDEVIKQIPSEEILAISKAIDQLKGVFIQQKA